MRCLSARHGAERAPHEREPGGMRRGESGGRDCGAFRVEVAVGSHGAEPPRCSHRWAEAVVVSEQRIVERALLLSHIGVKRLCSRRESLRRSRASAPPRPSRARGRPSRRDGGETGCSVRPASPGAARAPGGACGPVKRWGVGEVPWGWLGASAHVIVEELED